MEIWPSERLAQPRTRGSRRDRISSSSDAAMTDITAGAITIEELRRNHFQLHPHVSSTTLVNCFELKRFARRLRARARANYIAMRARNSRSKKLGPPGDNIYFTSGKKYRSRERPSLRISITFVTIFRTGRREDKRDKTKNAP